MTAALNAKNIKRHRDVRKTCETSEEDLKLVIYHTETHGIFMFMFLCTKPLLRLTPDIPFWT